MPALPQILEALLQASEEPLSSEALLAALLKASELHAQDEEAALPLPENLDQPAVDAALEQLEGQLVDQQRAVTLRRRPQGWKLVTRPDYAPYLRGLFPDARPSRLSGPALETLAIIAYRQPVTKAEIEAVRGVAVDTMVQKLLDLGLIRIEGRAEKPGRPLLFVTTNLFLEHFGLENKTQLPNHSELSRIELPEPPADPVTGPELPERQMTLGEAPIEAEGVPGPGEPEAQVTE